MKGRILWGSGVVLMMVSSIVAADFSGTVGVTSDYDYRGIAQTATDPALQGSLDFTHDSGFYASAWGSTLDWGDDSDADIEIDYIVGFSRQFGTTGLAWDAGVLAYTYPGISSANFVELYGGFSFKFFDIKLSYSDDFAGVGASGWYLNGGLGHEWENGFAVLAYAGYSFGNAFEDHEHRGPAIGFPDYWNFGFGFGYAIKNLHFELKGVGADLRSSHRVDSGVFANDLRAVLSVTLAVP